MAKATLTLSNGTIVTVEGTTEEVRELLEFYGSGSNPTASITKRHKAKGGKNVGSAKHAAKAGKDPESPALDLSEVITMIKDCDEAEAIEQQVLDRTSQVDRTLLPLYIMHKYFDNAVGMSSGDINKVTTDLGVPISTPNASSTLSGTASKYVIADQVRKRGRALKYKLNRRGVQYMQAIIKGNSSENKG